jgi:hypothetical protein
MRSALVIAVLLRAASSNSGAVVTMTECRILGNKARTDGGRLVNEDGGTMCFVAMKLGQR